MFHAKGFAPQLEAFRPEGCSDVHPEEHNRVGEQVLPGWMTQDPFLVEWVWVGITE